MKKIHLNRALAAKKKKLTILFALLCVSVMGFAIDWSGIGWVEDGLQGGALKETYKVSPSSENASWPAVVNIQNAGSAEKTGIYVTFPNGIVSCSLTSYGVQGGGLWMSLSNFSNQETPVEVTTEASITYHFVVYYKDGTTGGGGGSTPDPDPDPDPTPTGICASGTYTSNVPGSAIHAQVTKGVNKYYLTLTSATDGKTLTGLSNNNVYCYQYGNESRSEDQRSNYHMASDGRYSISEGAITFTIPSVGDPQMYTTLSVRFNDNTVCEISGLQGVRLVPCSTEDPVPYDPDPSEIEDTNFALSSNGAYAYASAVENQGKNAMVAIDGNNGTAFSTAHSDPQWFIVDLGQRRIFNTIQIRWEGAYATAFTIDVSNDGETWTNKVKETAYSKGGNNTEYEADLGSNVTARFVRFNGTARATQWGHSFYEFRVLLKGVPVLTSVDLVSDKKITKVGEYATLTASPKDQNSSAIAATLTYTVSPVDAGHVTDGKYYPEKYGLATITVTAEAGGKSLNNAVQIWGVVSDNLAYSSNIDTDNKVIDQSEITGDANNAFYAVNGSTADPWWQACRDLEDNKSNANFTSYFTLDLGKKYAINLIVIWFDGAASDDYTIAFSEDNSTWQEGYHISQSVGNYTHQKYLGLTDLNNNDQARYVRFTTTKASTTSGWGVKIKEMEVYGAEVSSTKTVSATVTPEASGTVTITADDVPVTEVPSGTLVKFTASANDGYDFVNWTQGGVEVSTSLEYSTMITSNTALVANFEPHRTAYCGTPVADTNGRTLYLTISRTANDNEYKILLEGSEKNRITNTNVYIGTALRLRNVNGASEYHFSNGEGIWHISSEGFGSAYITFTASNFRNISFVNKDVVLYRNMSYGTGSDLSSFNAFPDANLIKWDATCVDGKAPELAAPVATPLSGTSVRLALSATDNMSALLTYHINYKPTGDAGASTDVDVLGTAGAITYHNIKGLSAGTNYTFTVTVSDAVPNTSDPQSCTATPAMPTVPAPTREAAAVLSIYSDAYESALAHDFIKNNWSWPTYTEQNVGGDNLLVYTSDPAHQAQMPDVAWGANNDGDDALIAKDGYNDGTNKGLDVRAMKYLHFDMWSAVATIYPEVYLNDTKLAGFHLDGSGWQSFDIPLSSLEAAQKNNIRWIKFIALRTPNPEEIAIDNVYFWSAPKYTRNDSWMAPGELGTVCYPEGLRFAGAKLYQMAGTDANGKFVFDEVEVLQPGVPYLFEATANTIQFYATPATRAENAGTSNGMVGTFSEMTIPQNSPNIYYFSGKKFYAVTARQTDLTVPANRAYVDLKTPQPATAPKPGIRRITFDVEGTNTTTGVDQLNASDAPAKAIINGHLFILRGDKMYDATGRMVK